MPGDADHLANVDLGARGFPLPSPGNYRLPPPGVRLSVGAGQRLSVKVLGNGVREGSLDSCLRLPWSAAIMGMGEVCMTTEPSATGQLDVIRGRAP